MQLTPVERQTATTTMTIVDTTSGVPLLEGRREGGDVTVTVYAHEGLLRCTVQMSALKRWAELLTQGDQS